MSASVNIQYTVDIIAQEANESEQGVNIIGWDVGQAVVVNASTGRPLNFAFSDDGGVLTDETTPANEDTADDVTLLPAVPVVGDAYYFGQNLKFDEIQIDVSTAGIGAYTLTWEYSRNGSFISLPVTDGTNNYKNAGINIVSFVAPDDWTSDLVPTAATAFWVRAVVDNGSVTTAPLGRRIYIDPGRALETIVTALTISVTGEVSVITDLNPIKLRATKYGLTIQERLVTLSAATLQTFFMELNPSITETDRTPVINYDATYNPVTEIVTVQTFSGTPVDDMNKLYDSTQLFSTDSPQFDILEVMSTVDKVNYQMRYTVRIIGVTFNGQNRSIQFDPGEQLEWQTGTSISDLNIIGTVDFFTGVGNLNINNVDATDYVFQDADDIHNLTDCQVGAVENQGAAVLADSYSDTNVDSGLNLDDTRRGISQSFTNAATGRLSNIQWYLQRSGTISSGTIVAKLYAINNAIGGGDDVPTGPALATSIAFDPNLIDTVSPAWYQFVFTDEFQMQATTDYVATIEMTTGDASNFIAIGTDTSAPTHPGNAAETFTFASWTALAGTDCAFQISREGILQLNLLGDSVVPAVQNNTGTPPGATLFIQSVTQTITALDTGSRVVWIRQSDEAELENQLESGGTASFTYNAAELGGVDVYISILSLNKRNRTIDTTLPSTDSSLPASQTDDPFYFNPP